MSKVQTIAEIHGHRRRTDGVGIEVEVESLTPLPADIGGVWLTKTDESLRNYHYEYVCRQPIKVGPDKIKHIRCLTDKLNVPGAKLDMSHRTSVHVHRNVQHFTPVEVWTTIIAYWMIEDALINFCGNSRRGNLFCLPLSSCEGVLSRCNVDLGSGTPFGYFPAHACKYGGQNLATIAALGSIEYRTMRGTTDPYLIDKWSSALWYLGERARSFRDPAALMDYYLDSSKDELLHRLLPAEFVSLVTSAPNYVGLIRSNVMLLADLAYTHDDWLAWQDNLFKERETKLSSRKKSIEGLLSGQAIDWTIPVTSLGTTAEIIE
jgi:hypothetical protein